MRILLLLLALCIGGFLYNNWNGLSWHKVASFLPSHYHLASNSSGVYIYTLTGCVNCKIIENELDQAGINYVEYNINTDPQHGLEMVKRLKSMGFNGEDHVAFPVLYVGNQIFFGLTPISQIQSAISFGTHG